MTAPIAVVIVFPGSNGDRDLAETFTRAGFETRLHASSEPLPVEVTVAGLPGGFSYGDYWRAGVLASRAAAVQTIPDLVARGGLAIGICNGFQILVEAGMLPGALAYNAPLGFRHRWLEVEVASTQGPWLDGLDEGRRLRMPMANGEGRYVHPDGAAALEDRVPLRYIENPNGSLRDTAALLDETGRVLGIMPHPERASDPLLGSDDGLALFRSARESLGTAA